jgi:hypothetical protein
VKLAALIALKRVTKSVFYCVVTAPTSVLYVHALKQEVHNLVQTFMLYALKYVGPVQWNVQNTPCIMPVVKLVLKLAQNALLFVKSLQLLNSSSVKIVI